MTNLQYCTPCFGGICNRCRDLRGWSKRFFNQAGDATLQQRGRHIQMGDGWCSNGHRLDTSVNQFLDCGKRCSAPLLNNVISTFGVLIYDPDEVGTFKLCVDTGVVATHATNADYPATDLF